MHDSNLCLYDKYELLNLNYELYMIYTMAYLNCYKERIKKEILLLK